MTITTYTWDYTGSDQTCVVPNHTGTIKIEAIGGALGGDSPRSLDLERGECERWPTTCI